ncbi:MAG: DUF3899 domain-containing protein [Clostridia bacterium]|nr:DUF3899 domain-containing protein [Clostridia bacterium]
MISEKKNLLLKYAVCIGVALLITVAVFWSKGFFTDSAAVNIQILSDGFFVSGIVVSSVAGLLFVGGEGMFISVGYVFRNVVLIFIPGGRKKHERYADYRARKLEGLKKEGDHCILVTGLSFLALGVLFSVIWYMNFYQMPV